MIHLFISLINMLLTRTFCSSPILLPRPSPLKLSLPPSVSNTPLIPPALHLYFSVIFTFQPFIYMSSWSGVLLQLLGDGGDLLHSVLVSGEVALEGLVLPHEGSDLHQRS